MSIEASHNSRDRIRDYERNGVRKKLPQNYLPVPPQLSHACKEGHNLKLDHLEEKSNENKFLDGYCERLHARLGRSTFSFIANISGGAHCNIFIPDFAF
jgi:hypothetical protein